MAISLKPGARLFSSVCGTQMITVKAPPEAVELTIGGRAPVSSGEEARAAGPGGAVAEGHGGGAVMGKRYVDDAGTVELLCTNPGDGVPAINGELLQLKATKPLPASD
jgi:hypothetical protein